MILTSTSFTGTSGNFLLISTPALLAIAVEAVELKFVAGVIAVPVAVALIVFVPPVALMV